MTVQKTGRGPLTLYGINREKERLKSGKKATLPHETLRSTDNLQSLYARIASQGGGTLRIPAELIEQFRNSIFPDGRQVENIGSTTFPQVIKINQLTEALYQEDDQNEAAKRKEKSDQAKDASNTKKVKKKKSQQRRAAARVAKAAGFALPAATPALLDASKESAFEAKLNRAKMAYNDHQARLDEKDRRESNAKLSVKRRTVRKGYSSLYSTKYTLQKDKSEKKLEKTKTATNRALRLGKTAITRF